MKLKELLKHHNINWPTDADLVDALRSAGFAFRFEDRLAIYQKWVDRPLPAPGHTQIEEDRGNY